MGIAVLILFLVKYRTLPQSTYIPGAAWTRALLYMILCNIISVLSGTFDILITRPLVTASQLADWRWILFCGGCFLYIFIAYWILWAKMILTFDRKYYIGSEIVFGLLWGWSTGQVLLSFYHLWHMTGWSPVIVYLGILS